MKCMPIDAPEGTKVVFAYPKNGTSGDQAHAQRLGLKEGDEYTVEDTDAGGFSTTLWLREFPGERFNTVNFTLTANARVQAAAEGGRACNDLLGGALPEKRDGY